MMEFIEIKGGNKLSGKITISGAKNCALPALAATLLSKGRFIIQGVPRLQDVSIMVELLQSLGQTISYSSPETLQIVQNKPLEHEAPYHLVRKLRASVLVLGPLTARLGRAKVPYPGGCAIGSRPIDLHIKGLKLMGAEVKIKEGFVETETKRLHGARIFFDITSVTGTENIMMAAALAKGETVIENAAREPEVVALGEMLLKMGAKIRGLGTETIKIEGVNELSGVEFKIIPDRIETGTYMMAVGAAGGELELENCVPGHLTAVIDNLRTVGLEISCDESGTINIKKKGKLQSIDINTAPYPGFPTDLQAQIMVLMSIANGLSVITEKIFENRFMHVAELKRLGADIKIQGNNAIVRGVSELTGAPVMATDLRASACLILAGLAARGKTIIHDIHHLDRGYERMDEKLSKVGGHIKRIKSEQSSFPVA